MNESKKKSQEWYSKLIAGQPGHLFYLTKINSPESSTRYIRPPISTKGNGGWNFTIEVLERP